MELDPTEGCQNDSVRNRGPLFPLICFLNGTMERCQKAVVVFRKAKAESPWGAADERSAGRRAGSQELSPLLAIPMK